MGELLDAANTLGPRIRELGPKAEADRRLPDELAQAFGEAGVRRMCTLRVVGRRDFRDIDAATQHRVVSTSTYEPTGRLLLGVETEVSQL